MKITSWQNLTLFNLPDGWWPKRDAYGTVAVQGGKVALIQATPSGNFNLRGLGGGDISTFCFATLTYVTA